MKSLNSNLADFTAKSILKTYPKEVALFQLNLLYDFYRKLDTVPEDEDSSVYSISIHSGSNVYLWKEHFYLTDRDKTVFNDSIVNGYYVKTERMSGFDKNIIKSRDNNSRVDFTFYNKELAIDFYRKFGKLFLVAWDCDTLDRVKKEYMEDDKTDTF